MLRDFADERELRGALYDLTGRFAETRTVLLLLGEYTAEELGSGVEFSLADGIIQLECEAREPVDRRTLRVVKMRGGSSVAGRHTFQINSDGIRIFPRIETLIPAAVVSVTGRMHSGIPGLERLMPGGMRRGDDTLVMGPSGVGKTTLALRWVAQGLEDGETCPCSSPSRTPPGISPTWARPSAGTSAPPVVAGHLRCSRDRGGRV